tara:strand:- start:1658 stop:1834 length:177 start_codon:yes stop_codon:yes gene_type:complete
MCPLEPEETIFIGTLLEVVCDLMLEADGEQTYAIIAEKGQNPRKGEGTLVLIPERADA